MDVITSVQNPLVKELAKLKNAAQRRKTGLFLIEGVKLCREALGAGIEIRYCFYEPGELPADFSAYGRAIQTNAAVIAKLSEAKSPQHIVMVGVIPSYQSEEIDGRLVLALDGVSDPANLGSMIRTAEAFGVQDVLCSDTTVDLYSTKVLRGAMGSSFRVRVHRGDLMKQLSDLKKKGYTLYATGLHRSALKLNEVAFSEKSAVIIGNEGNGIELSVFAISDQTVFIPMIGKNESLNAAAAAAVVLWQCFGGES